MAPVSSLLEPWLAVPGWRPPRLSPRLQRALEARRALLPDGPGVLVLDGRGPPAPLGVPATPEGGWSAIVTVLALAGRPDLVASLRQLDAVLAPGGALWLLEPTSEPGMLATLATTLWPPAPALGRLHLGRDVPAAVRAAGFAITDIERFTMPTTHRPLRPFVALRARRAEPTAAPAGQG